MPIRVVTGPPFAGKSQKVRAARRKGDLTLDTTSIWKAFVDPEAVIRGVDDAQIANAMKRKGLDIAVEQGRDGWIIVAERDPIRLKRWLAAADQQKAWLVSEPMDELLRRARKRGPECEELLVGWDNYEDDPEFMALTEMWSEDEMRTIHEVEIQYRSALAGITVRESGCDVQHRCLTDRAELRAEGGSSRVVTGIAVRYGDEARLGGFRERIKRGALELPSIPANLTMQHDRAMPLGLLEWQDDDDALRFRTELSDGAEAGPGASRRAGRACVRGASLEFMPEEGTSPRGEPTRRRDRSTRSCTRRRCCGTVARGRRSLSAVVYQSAARASLTHSHRATARNSGWALDEHAEAGPVGWSHGGVMSYGSTRSLARCPTTSL